VRKALSLLIPRTDLLIYKQRNLSTLASSLISPAFKGQSFMGKVDEYNPILASSLLDQAGYKRDLKAKGQRFSLNWRISNNKAAIEVAESIASSFEREGIKINLLIQEWGTFYRGFKNGEYDLVTASWVGIAGPEMLRAVFHSENFAPKGMNRGYYSNAVFDKKIDEATKETDAVKRRKFYQEAQKTIDQDYPYLYLWHPRIIWIGRKNLNLGPLYPNGSFLPLLNLCTVRLVLSPKIQGKSSQKI
jgi:ABC-type transport system substrate-binding protein